MIEVEQLTRRYGALVAVDSVSFSVQRGEVMGLLGPNGAGKTTTLRILCGCLGPTSGTVRIAGHDITAAPRLARAALGYLPEQPPLYEEMTVRDFVDHAARLRLVGRGVRASAVDQALELTDLQDVQRRLVGHLSKGYRQRVGLAQALVHSPAVLVLDEPTSGLDPTQMAGMRRLIHQLRGQRTILISTHLLGEATSLCDRVTILAGGRAVASGTEDELRAQLLAEPSVRIEIEGDPAECAAALEAMECVGAVQRDGRCLVVTLNTGTPSARSAVNGAAAAFGLLSSRPADGLEELFLRAVAS